MLLPDFDQHPILTVCLSCGNTMKPVRTILKLGVNPELLVFVCPSCNEVELHGHQIHEM
jgi:hypothetical protein